MLGEGFWKAWRRFGSWDKFWSVVDAGVWSGVLGLWWVVGFEGWCFEKVEVW